MPSELARIDKSLELLRSHDAKLSDSFSQQLEDRLMREQQRQLSGSRALVRRSVWAGLIVAGVLAAGAASLAATGGWRGWLRTYWIESDGIVTNENEEVVGGSFQNDDGSYTTIIHSEHDDTSYAIHTEKSPAGRSLKMLRVGESER